VRETGKTPNILEFKADPCSREIINPGHLLMLLTANEGEIHLPKLTNWINNTINIYWALLKL